MTNPPINPKFWIDVIRTQAHVTDCREKQQALKTAADTLEAYIASTPQPTSVSEQSPEAGSEETERLDVRMARWRDVRGECYVAPAGAYKPGQISPTGASVIAFCGTHKRKGE
jgi:hypothetical protein